MSLEDVLEHTPPKKGRKIVNREELLQRFPSQRIKPVDGMAVTAEVWEEAHQYHRQSQGYHLLFSHGPGVLTGLEVIASEPPDTSVYILPGIAIDPLGQTIVLPKPVSYDIGTELEGQLYLLLAYGESRPKAPKGSKKDEGAPLYVETEFSVFARTVLPEPPWVELARVNRSSREAVFRNAEHPARPGPDEIDLRFRREVGAPPQVSLAISYLGSVADKKQGAGAYHLAQALNRTGQFNILVEDDVPVGPGIVTNTLVYLVGQGKFEMESGVMNGLRNYVHRGKGTLLIESMDAKAETSFMEFLKTTNMEPKPLPAGHSLLTQPYLFAVPPAGFESGDSVKLLFSEGVIFSTYNYGLLWQGERRSSPPSREILRAGIEWGGNIITYAMQRRRLSGKL